MHSSSLCPWLTIKTCCVHIFVCSALQCKGKGQQGQEIQHYLDMGDVKSTSNLCHHAKVGWGVKVISAADKTKDVFAAHDAMAKVTPRDGSLLSAFESIKKANQVVYSHWQHTRVQVHLGIVQWVSENMQPFSIVKDHWLFSLMKTGRTDYHVPSPQTVETD